MIKSVYGYFYELIHRPMKVFWICVFLSAVGVVLDGTAFRLWSLKRDHLILKERIRNGRSRSKQLEFRIQKALQPEFIEKVARDQFDLVKEGDLIFIFTEESSEASEKTSGVWNQ